MATVAPQPECSLVGGLAQIRPLRFADLPEMAAWEPHPNPLLRAYNLHFDSPASWRHWLQKRLQHRWAYAIRSLEGDLVGHMSLRQIDHPRSARLGITIAADYVGRGYGRDAMCTFLDYFFGELGFEEMRLDVSGANLPARRLYQKLGFKQQYGFWLAASPAEERMSVRDKQMRRHFRQGKERYYEMHLRARNWRRVPASLE
jgi:RimJ/RimL family protein N-acetyltransferase